MSLLNDLLLDVRYGARQLRRAPLFTLVASLSVAIGIIVAVSAFTALNAVLFKPLPVPDPNGIYHLYTSDYDGRSEPYGSSSYADYGDFAASGAFRSLAASSWRQVAVAQQGSEPKTEYMRFVSPNFFGTLGLQVARGRAFGTGDAGEIIITWPYWQRVFGGDPGVLGSTIRVNSIPLTIVGVAPESFRGVGIALPLIGWAPAATLPAILRDADALRHRGSRQFALFGRLPDGQSVSTAVTRLNAIAAGLAEQNPKSWRDSNGEPRLVSVLSHRQSLAPPGARTQLVFALGAAALLVLFIVLLACTNVAALLVGRAVGRHHEIAVRLTLGASRRRLIRQLLTESMLLAAIGGVVSFVGLMWTIRLVSRIPVAEMIDLRPDWRVLLVALMTSLTCALIFGLAPALQSMRVDLKSGLTGTAASPKRNRLRGALIAFQVAASCVLIMLAFSAVRGVRTYVAIDPGIELDGLVSLEIDRSVFGDDSIRAATYLHQVRQMLATLPGVRSAATTALLPLGDGTTGAELDVPGRTGESVEINTVGASFFETVRVSPIRGRVFNATDTRASAPVAVVNRAFLDEYGAENFGGLVKVNERAGVRIVGVVPEISYHDPRRAAPPMIYVVDEQIPWGASRERFLLRVASGTEAAVAATLRGQIRSRFPDLVVPTVETMREHTARQTMPHRIGGNVALAIGGIELALATVGLYGLLMFALLARTREIGVRLALGASPREASWAVMRDGMRYAAYGAGVGMLLAIPAAFVAQNALPGARAADPLPFIAALSAVLAAAAVASFAPVRKAGRVDPATALRYD